MKKNRFIIFSMLGVLLALTLLHFNAASEMQIIGVVCVYFSVLGYNLAIDSDNNKFAFSWSFLFCTVASILGIALISEFMCVYAFLSVVFIFLNFADSSEYKQETKGITGKEVTKEITQDTQQVKTQEYNAKDIVLAKNKLQLIEIDSKKMTVEVVVPQNLGYFFETIDNLINEKQSFDNFIQWVKFVNNNCYAAYCLIESDNDRIDTLECLQRIMSITTHLLNKYGGDCFVETK